MPAKSPEELVPLENEAQIMAEFEEWAGNTDPEEPADTTTIDSVDDVIDPTEEADDEDSDTEEGTEEESEEEGESEDDSEDDDEESDEGDEGEESDDETSEDDEADDDDDGIDAATISKIERREKRMLDRVKKAESKIAERETQLADSERLIAQERDVYSRASQMVDVDPLGALKLLGAKDDVGTLEYIAKKSFAQWKAASGDPAYREQARQLEAQRANTVQTSAQAQELAKVRQDLEMFKLEKQVATYMEGIHGAVSEDEAPLVAELLSRKPKKAQKELRRVADRLADELGELADPEDVIDALEKERRELAEEFGEDVAAKVRRTKKKKKTKKGKKSKSAKVTLNSNIGTKTKPLPEARSYEEEWESVIGQMP